MIVLTYLLVILFSAMVGIVINVHSSGIYTGSVVAFFLCFILLTLLT